MAKKRKKNKYGLIPGSRRAGFVIPKDELYTVIANERQKFLTTPAWSRSHYYYMTILIAHGLGVRGTDAVNLTWSDCIDADNSGELILEESKKEHLKGTRSYSKQRSPRIQAFTKLMREAYRNTYQHKRPSRKVFSNLHPDYYKATRGRGHTPFPEDLAKADTIEDWYVRVMKRNSVDINTRTGGVPFWSCARVTWGRMQYNALIEVMGANGKPRYTPNQAISHLQSMFNHTTPQMTRHYLRLGAHDEEVVDHINDSFKVGDILSKFDSNRVVNPNTPAGISKANKEGQARAKSKGSQPPPVEIVAEPTAVEMNQAAHSVTNDFDFGLMDKIGSVSSEA